MSNLEPSQRVSLETACQRALKYLNAQHPAQLASASGVGNAIWPDSNMTGQGLGAAASRVLKIMQSYGHVVWQVRPSRVPGGKASDWGYKITSKGRGVVRAILEDENEQPKRG
jgi:hypothetical protein